MVGRTNSKVKWISARRLEMIGFAQVLSKVEAKELLNDQFASDVEKLRNEAEKLYTTGIIAQSTLLLVLLLGIIPLGSSISLFGITVAPGGKLREVLVAVITTMTFHHLAMQSKIFTMTGFLYQYALSKGVDEPTRATLMMRYSPLRIRSPLPFSFVQEEVRLTSFSLLLFSVLRVMNTMPTLIIPIVLNSLYIIALIDIWSSPAFPRWISFSLVVYAAIGTVAAFLSLAIIALPLPFRFSKIPSDLSNPKKPKISN